MKRSILTLILALAALLPIATFATALTDNFSAPKLGGENPVAQFTVLDAEIMYAGGIAAVDYTDEAQMAADTAGLKVVGRVKKKVDNTDDGESVTIETGIFRYNNSSTYPIPRSAIGQNAYVEDDNTVAAFATNLVSCGIIHDIDSDGVWVDMRPAALAAAWEARPAKRVAKVAAYTVTAAIAFEGRSYFNCALSGGGALEITLPTAVAGMRVGVQRGSATAADDVTIQAATGDTIQGSDAMSAAGKQVDNTVDAVSGIVWYRAVSDTVWAIDNPAPTDVASWVKNDT